MKMITLKRCFANFCINHILSGTKFFEQKRSLLRFAGYEIGEGTKVVGPIFCSGSLKIGDNCWIGRNFAVVGNGKVEIEDDCDIAPDVMFVTGGHDIGDENRRAGKGKNYHIKVGKGTWIGARATVAKEADIGKGCVIAACACVVSDIDDNVLAGGVPAKVIKNL